MSPVREDFSDVGPDNGIAVHSHKMDACSINDGDLSSGLGYYDEEDSDSPASDDGIYIK